MKAADRKWESFQSLQRILSCDSAGFCNCHNTTDTHHHQHDDQRLPLAVWNHCHPYEQNRSRAWNFLEVEESSYKTESHVMQSLHCPQVLMYCLTLACLRNTLSSSRCDVTNGQHYSANTSSKFKMKYHPGFSSSYSSVRRLLVHFLIGFFSCDVEEQKDKVSV